MCASGGYLNHNLWMNHTDVTTRCRTLLATGGDDKYPRHVGVSRQIEGLLPVTAQATAAPDQPSSRTQQRG